MSAHQRLHETFEWYLILQSLSLPNIFSLDLHAFYTTFGFLIKSLAIFLRGPCTPRQVYLGVFRIFLLLSCFFEYLSIGADPGELEEADWAIAKEMTIHTALITGLTI